MCQHAINAIWLTLRTYKTVQLMDFMTNLTRMSFEMPNGTYSHRWQQVIKNILYEE